MNSFFRLKISMRPVLALFGKTDAVKPSFRDCGGEPKSGRMLDERELLRRLRSIRAALGPAVADQAIGRAAVAIAKAVHEFAERRATQGKRGPNVAPDMPTASQAAGKSSAEEKWHIMRSSHGDIP